MVLPVAQLLFVEALIILRTRMSQGIVIWMIRLDQNSSGPIATPRTSRNLRNELKRSFRRSKVGQRETGVNRDHTDQRHVRKVVSFGKHLRTDEGIDAARTERCQRLLNHFSPRRGVAIDSRDTQSRQEQPQHLLELLGALANVVNVFLSARRA